MCSSKRTHSLFVYSQSASLPGNWEFRKTSINYITYTGLKDTYSIITLKYTSNYHCKILKCKDISAMNFFQNSFNSKFLCWPLNIFVIPIFPLRYDFLSFVSSQLRVVLIGGSLLPLFM